ncbi:MAG: hypothetical protein ACFFF4_01070 [Candidatus Thorarchaeota archaeon]
MVLLSTHEAVVWWEFHHGRTTAEIASEYERRRLAPDYILEVFNESDSDAERKRIQEKMELKDPAYVSRVLNRARSKIEKALRNNASSHRLDVESVQDYKGLLIGFDYQAGAQVYIVYTIRLGTIVWYKHDAYAGKLCDGTSLGNGGNPDGEKCPKYNECRHTLDTILREYNISLRPDEEQLYMTEQAIAIFNKLAAKEVPRYKRPD